METFKKVSEGTMRFRWSEYLTLLFIFWNNSTREKVEEKGLFPKVLKEAMATNHNAHRKSVF